MVAMGSTWTRIRRQPKLQITSKGKNVDRILLLVAIILGAYFLSQVGFVNRVTNSTIHSYTVDLDRMKVSSNPQDAISLYSSEIPEPDAFSAAWLLNHRVETARVFADVLSEYHALASQGLVLTGQILPITNTTIPEQGSFLYLGRLNAEIGIVTTYGGSFHTSEIYTFLDENNLVYSNGNSEIWYVIPVR